MIIGLGFRTFSKRVGGRAVQKTALNTFTTTGMCSTINNPLWKEGSQSSYCIPKSILLCGQTYQANMRKANHPEHLQSAVQKFSEVTVA